MRRILFLLILCGLVTSSKTTGAAEAMNAVAERYVHLVLALGQHDPDYVDAFYGPAEWKTEAEKEKKLPDAIGAEAAELSATLAKVPAPRGQKGSELSIDTPPEPLPEAWKSKRAVIRSVP